MYLIEIKKIKFEYAMKIISFENLNLVEIDFKNGEKYWKFNIEIKPQLYIELNKIFKIISYPENYIIREFIIVTDLNDIFKEMIILNAWHPNASDYIKNSWKKYDPPEEQYFCKDEYTKAEEFTIEVLYDKIEIMKNHNYKSCYWQNKDNLKLEEHEIKLF